MSAARIWLGPVPVDGVDLAQALARVSDLVERGEGGTVFTPNVDHLLVAHDDAAFREAYASADLSLVDGTPVLWICRLLGLPVREKVSGSDLVRPLMAAAAASGLRVYLLGATPEVARRALAVLVAEVPGLQIVGTSSPWIDMSQPPSARDSVRAELRRAQADLVLVALGAPKAEKFSHECRDALRPAVLVCIGAGLDFVAGAVRRAPPWMSACALEWLFRLAQEPRRLWRRSLLRGPRAVPLFLKLLRGRARARVAPAERATAAGGGASRSA